MAEELLKIEGLKKSFGNLEVLKGLTTTIRTGEVVVMIGPSGGGKSTFLRCMNLLVPSRLPTISPNASLPPPTSNIPLNVTTSFAAPTG